MRNHALIAFFVLIALVSGACGLNFNINLEQGSGNVVKETRPVSGFDRVSLAGLGDVVLTQGDEESLEIEAEDNVIANIKTEVRGGTLYITYERKSLLPTKPVRFFLTMREVRAIESLGMTNLRSDRIDTDQLDITISGTGNIDILRLNAGTISTIISGAGNFEAEGTVGDQKVTLSGAGNYNGEDLQSERSTVTITGLGKVTTWATKELDVTISGSGGVDYYGSPEIRKNISGIGTLNHKGNK